jgi:hypothetical protein
MNSWMRAFVAALSFPLGACVQNSTDFVPDGGARVDAAPTAARPPGGRGFVAAGFRTQSARYTLTTTTGQATPVDNGPSHSGRYTLRPGITEGSR